ncbi:hypothetical protein [Fimbriimonas ginsengisoli]|uniref:Uncharacterized protein n=1 Tax=Fimbriimonas ginsengisoli Gsoil 348 TaxID=661478 RepID=A0A068NQ71_FIMGI|nr:hypothetical protein [Fimbriimonas ginsengisoli]AIE85708.1 hypothetical protein OP10G_2340 [Fimbriimonas ginsengisoli Gsoil 348]
MLSSRALSGNYLGLKKVREGREDELSPKERKELQKAKPDVDLALRGDGTFKRQVTEGTWEVEGERVVFKPTTFGGESLEKMKSRTEEMGRTFTLGFVFAPFELAIEGEALVTPDENAIIVTEFRRQW